MLQSTFLVTLLAGSVFAAPVAEGSAKTADDCSSLSASSTPIEEGYGPTLASQPVYSAPPTPAVPTGASVTPSITTAPSVPLPSAPTNDDQPAMFESYTFSWSSAWNPATFTELAFTETIATPLMSINPVYPTTPISMPTGAPEVPTTPLPVETSCTEEEAQKTDTPLDTTTASTAPPTTPTGTYMRPTGVPYPSNTGDEDEHRGADYGYGYGRPRPSDMWPSKHRPSGGFHHSQKPAPSSTTCTEETEASTTMQTSVRPTPTAGGY